MIKLTTQLLADKFNITRQAVSQWFLANDKDINNLDDVVDYVMINRLKK